MKNSIIGNRDRAAIPWPGLSFLGMTERLRKETLMKATVALLVSFSPAVVGANLYVQHNLVSDIPGVADQTDARLVNPWGLAASSTSPFWVANNHSGTSTLYNGAGQPFPAVTPLVVTVPVPPAAQASHNPQPSAAAGVAFNDTTGFNVASGKTALFLFAAEDGTISGWNSGIDPANASRLVGNSPAGGQYTGPAVA